MFALTSMENIKGLLWLTSYLQHGEDVMVPKTPIGRVYLRDVAEELLGINFTKYGIVLKIAQTVEEQLKE